MTVIIYVLKYVAWKGVWQLLSSFHHVPSWLHCNTSFYSLLGDHYTKVELSAFSENQIRPLFSWCQKAQCAWTVFIVLSVALLLRNRERKMTRNRQSEQEKKREEVSERDFQSFYLILTGSFRLHTFAKWQKFSLKNLVWRN